MTKSLLTALLLSTSVIALSLHTPPPEPASAFPVYDKAAQAFPRTFCYGTINGVGRPFIKYVTPHLSKPFPPYDSTLDTAHINRAARFDMVAWHAAPILPWREDILVAMRRANPQQKIMAYITCGHTFSYFVAPGHEKDFQTRWYEGVNAVDSHVYCSAHPNEKWVDADPAFANAEVDLSRLGVADSLADLIIEVIVNSDTTFDGVFLDTFGPSFTWMNSYNGHFIDYARAGHATLALMDTARFANCRRIIDRIRAAAPPGFIVMANGPGSEDMRKYADGWLWEGFPNQAYGGTGWNAMYPQYRTQDNEPYPILKEESGFSGNAYSSTTQQEYRFVLGTACLGAGLACIGTDTVLEPPTYHPFSGWIYDEASVTHFRDGGRADTTGQHRNWLGRPLGDAQRLSNGVYKREFVNGIVLVNPNTGSRTVSLPKSYTRIRGVRNPTFNNGATASTFFLNPNDAIFLLTPTCR